jgi:hypothetical protein
VIVNSFIAVIFYLHLNALRPVVYVINPATKYIVFRATRMRQIKAQLAAKGCSLGKSCNAELVHSCSPYLFDFNM